MLLRRHPCRRLTVVSRPLGSTKRAAVNGAWTGRSAALLARARDVVGDRAVRRDRRADSVYVAVSCDGASVAVTGRPSGDRCHRQAVHAATPTLAQCRVGITQSSTALTPPGSEAVATHGDVAAADHRDHRAVGDGDEPVVGRRRDREDDRGRRSIVVVAGDGLDPGSR